MPLPLIIRFEPIISATGVMVVTWATGIPAFSISTTIAAPQRVLVAQVDVRIAPSTSSTFNRSAIPRPIFLEFSSVVATPVVE